MCVGVCECVLGEMLEHSKAALVIADSALEENEDL